MTQNTDKQAEAGAYLATLEEQLEQAMKAYCQWRKPYSDPYRYAENQSYLDKIEQLRRKIASEKAYPEDVVRKMRLLDNWLDAQESGKNLTFETPDGDYELSENDVTYAWLARTPDGKFEGPFHNAQEAADWAATDWEEVFFDNPEP